MDGERQRLPLFPLGTVLFPDQLLPLHLFEDRYRRLMADQEGRDPVFGVVLVRRGREVADQPQVHPVGTAASLVAASPYPDGRLDVVVRGGRRFRVRGVDWHRGYAMAEVDWLNERVGPGDAVGVGAAAVEALRSFLGELIRVKGQDVPPLGPFGDPLALSYALGGALPVEATEQQGLLEADTAVDRLERINAILTRERGLIRRTGVGVTAIPHPGSGFTAN